MARNDEAQRGRIFLVGPSEGVLTPMDETAYEKEDLLQNLLVTYPDLLPGDQITPEAPRRWLLVAREMGVPDSENPGDRWSLDHLYLDQDGIPTLVECKRSSDPRIRREVIAQMLEYTANGLKHWKGADLRERAAKTAEQRGRTLDEEVLTLLGNVPDADVERYWQLVETNLAARHVRLLFVADNLPPELRQLIEFLNEQLNDIEVLGVEVKQYLGVNNQRVMVSRVLGATEAARAKKPVPVVKTTQEVFLQASPPEAVAVFERVLALAASRSYVVYWGQKGFSIRPPISGALTSVLYGWPPNVPPTRLEFYTGYLGQKLAPEQVQGLREELLRLGIFTKSGEHTLRAAITPSTSPQIVDALPIIFGLIERLVAQNDG